MKHFLFLMMLLSTYLSIYYYFFYTEEETANAQEYITTLSFENVKHDFGIVSEGDTVEHIFKLQNTGQKPLIIDSIKSSCSCVIPKWSNGFIAPNENEYMKVAFIGIGKPGKQSKTLSVFANTKPNIVRLTITANVKKR